MQLVGLRSALALDVTSPDAGERAVQACVERFGRIDALVNGAGTSAVRSVEQLSDEEWQAQWELHVMAPMRLMRAAAPAMARARVGTDRQRVLVVGQAAVVDQHGLLGDQGRRAVAVAGVRRRVGVARRARQLGVAGAGCRGSCGSRWAASPTRTPKRAAGTREEVLESVAARQPIGRLGTEQEIADVIVFLCSEPASNVAGAAWSVDGGAVPVII